MTPLKTIPLNDVARRKFEKQWNTSEQLQRFGCTLELSSEDLVKVHIDPIQKYHRGGMGTQALHGGILASLFDLSIGVVGVMQSDGHSSGTVQLSISFIRPVTGNKAVAEAWLIRATKKFVFAEAHIKDEKGNICCKAQGICTISKEVNSNYNLPNL